jgi:predicted ATPase/DNA-binding CsgD family transcriptional regulator
LTATKSLAFLQVALPLSRGTTHWKALVLSPAYLNYSIRGIYNNNKNTSGYIVSMAEMNFPLQLTTLVGRDQEVVAICARLQQPAVRLLTLTGTGGIGKTRLGIQVATNLSAAFTSGVCFVSLASLHDPALVFPTIAQALGVLNDANDIPLLERLKMHLHTCNLLLLLDNFEQVITAAPGLEELLITCPGIKILVTSRALLRINGEHEFPVAPLALPDPQHLGQGTGLSHYPAIALFVQRAQSIKPDFQLTTANAPVIADICTRLDGLPLAIELAAARIKLLPPQTLLKHLKQSLQILTNPLQNVPQRQQTLHRTLTWSYELLTAQEQQLFRRLSVFVGGCTLEAAEVLSMTSTNADHLPFLDSVASLLNQSLLYQVEQDTGDARLFMLETIRTYGLGRLAASGERQQIHYAHALYFLTLAEEEEPELAGGEQQQRLAQLEREHDNLRTALYWLLEQKELEMALRLSGALWRYWWMTGQVNEGRTFLEQALRESKQAGIKIRAKALNALGTLIGLQGDFAGAETLCTESLRLFRSQDNIQGIVTSLWMLGYVASDQSHYTLALQRLNESLNLARQSGYLWGIAYSLELLAAIALHQGAYERARLLIEESLALSRQTGDTWGIARALWLHALIVLSLHDYVQAGSLFQESLECSRLVKDKRGIGNALVMSGYAAFFQHDYSEMRHLTEEGLTLLKEVGDRRGIAWGLYGRAWLALQEKNYETAYTQFEESLAILLDLKHEWFIVLCLEGMGIVAAAQQRPLQAAYIWGYADTRRRKAEVARPPIVHTLYEHHVAAAKTQTGQSAFSSAWSTGQTMTMEQMQQATSLKTPLPASHTPVTDQQTLPAGLTPREIEVLCWVTQGFTDNQVAEKLIISPRTVSTHLTSIYNKLNVTTRSAATRFAIEHHLL